MSLHPRGYRAVGLRGREAPGVYGEDLDRIGTSPGPRLTFALPQSNVMMKDGRFVVLVSV